MMEVFPGIEATAMFSHLKDCMSERKPVKFDNQFIPSDGKSGE